MSTSIWSQYSKPDPEWVEYLPTLPKTTAVDIPLTRKQISAFLHQALAKAGLPTGGLIVEERPIPVSGGEILIRTYVPDGDEGETYPVLVDFHGGGYSLGSLDTDEVKCRGACLKHRISVVNVDYRLAPEHPWPTGYNDSFEAVKWVAENPSEVKGDLSKGFIVGGLSAGGNFAAIVAQQAREDPSLKGKITGQILQIPQTLFGQAPEKFAEILLSYEQNKDDPILSRDNIRIFGDAYQAGPSDDPTVSPLLAESFAGLPPAYVQIAGADPLRDEGLLYEQLLRKEGVATKLDIYPGVPHGFSGRAPHLKISQKWAADYLNGLQWLLDLARGNV